MTATSGASAAPGINPASRNVLVLDISKSMLAPLPDTEDPFANRRKIDVARTATFRVLDSVMAQRSRFGLVVFNSTARVLVPLTEINGESRPMVDNMVSLLNPAGRSAIWDAVALGADLLRTEGGRVVGNLVLVTDGWDNMSQWYTIPELETAPNGTPGGTGRGRANLMEHLLPHGSHLTFHVIGIGSGDDRDKGVDSARMQAFLERFRVRAHGVANLSAARYQEVTNSAELFAEMVNAFVDVPFEGSEEIGALRPEEVAQHAALAARALREVDGHDLVHHLGTRRPSSEPASPLASPVIIDLISSEDTRAPAGHLAEKYGPVGEIAEAFLAKDWNRVQALLYQRGARLPPVTRFYWHARVQFALNNVPEAERFLAQAWAEAEKLPEPERRRIVRRLGILQAKVREDRATATLVQFFEAADVEARRLAPNLGGMLETMFDRLLELRRTYQGIQRGRAADHEKLVEDIFGLLQDCRLANTGRHPAIDGFLDFVEIALSEMR